MPLGKRVSLATSRFVEGSRAGCSRSQQSSKRATEMQRWQRRVVERPTNVDALVSSCQVAALDHGVHCCFIQFVVDARVWIQVAVDIATEYFPAHPSHGWCERQLGTGRRQQHGEHKQLHLVVNARCVCPVPIKALCGSQSTIQPQFMAVFGMLAKMPGCNSPDCTSNTTCDSCLSLHVGHVKLHHAGHCACVPVGLSLQWHSC